MALIVGDNLNNPNLNGDAEDDIIVGLGGHDTLRGLDGEDILSGGDNNDSLDGGANDDILDGGDGNDTLDGGTGDDVMDGGAGSDRLIWNNGDGSDFMNGGTDTDTVEVNGSNGDAGDLFELSQDDATVPNDVVFQRTNLVPFSLSVNNVERFEVNGLNGNDRLIVNNLSSTDVSRVTFNGGDGNDTLDGSLTTTVLVGNGGLGNDSLTGGSNSDTLSGDDGNDTISGGAGSDRIIWDVGNDNDLINGGSGIDTVEINGSVFVGDTFRLNQDASGNAIFHHIQPNPGGLPLLLAALTADQVERFQVIGNEGNDRLDVDNLSTTSVTQVRFSGGDGNDTLDGSDSSTVLVGFGDDNNDSLIGGSNNDNLSGGDGNDTLRGGGGNDTLTGGLGNDRFEFRSSIAFNATITVSGFPVDPNLGVDQITDFDPNSPFILNDSFDQIILDNDIFTSLLTPAGNALAAQEFAVVDFDSLAADSDARIVYSRGTGRLFYNQDSDNGDPASFGTGGLFAVLDANLNLTNNDFQVVA